MCDKQCPFNACQQYAANPMNPKCNPQINPYICYDGAEGCNAHTQFWSDHSDCNACCNINTCLDNPPPPSKCGLDHLFVKGECIAPGHGWVKKKGDIPYMNTCILPGECPPNTTYMGRCNGNTEEDTSYCLPNEIWCDDTSCWGPTNRYSDSWINSSSKGSLISCSDAYTGQNNGYPDRSNKRPNPDALKYPDQIGCRQGVGWCGVSNSNKVGQNRYQDPSGGPAYHKISHWLWPDTFQRHCVLKPN